jgi:hypothetical protein
MMLALDSIRPITIAQVTATLIRSLVRSLISLLLRAGLLLQEKPAPLSRASFRRCSRMVKKY